MATNYIIGTISKHNFILLKKFLTFVIINFFKVLPLSISLVFTSMIHSSIMIIMMIMDYNNVNFASFVRNAIVGLFTKIVFIISFVSLFWSKIKIKILRFI